MKWNADEISSSVGWKHNDIDIDALWELLWIEMRSAAGIIVSVELLFAEVQSVMLTPALWLFLNVFGDMRNTFRAFIIVLVFFVIVGLLWLWILANN